MDNVLNIQLKVDAATGMVTVEKFNDKLGGLSDNANKAKTHVTNLNTSFIGLKSAIDLASSVFNKVEELTADFSEQEQASIKLDTALKNAGITNPVVAASFAKVSSELEKMVNVDADAITAWQGLAVEMGNTPETTNKVIQAAIGLNKTYGTDMETAIRAATLGFEGNFMGLTRLIPQIKLAGDESSQMAAFVKVTENGWNQATAAAKSLSGQLEQQKIQWGNVKEELGQTLSTALIPALKYITEMTTFALENKNAIVAGTIAFGAAKAALFVFGIGLEGISLKLKAVAAEVTVATGGLNLLIAGIAAAAAIWITYETNQDSAMSASRAYSAETEKLVAGIEKLTKAQLEQRTKVLEKEVAAKAQSVWAMRQEIEVLRAKADQDNQEGMRAWQQLGVKELIIKRETAARDMLTNTLSAYKKTLAEVTAAEAKANAEKAIEANSKDAYLVQLKAKVAAGTELSKTEKEIFDKSFEYVQGYVTKSGNVIDGFYRRKKEQLTAEGKDQKEAFDKQLEVLKIYYAKVAAFDKSREVAIYDAEKHAAAVKERSNEEELKRMRAYGHEQVEIDDDVAANKRGNTKSTADMQEDADSRTWSSALQLSGMLAGKSQEMFMLNKGMQMAGAVMSTYRAATDALSAPPIGLGPVAGIPLAGFTIASGLVNVGMIAAQKYEPVNDFISIPGKPLLKANEDDIVIGGTNLLGNKTSGGNDALLKAINNQTRVLQKKQMSVFVDPLTGKKLYTQNIKGQIETNRRRVI